MAGHPATRPGDPAGSLVQPSLLPFRIRLPRHPAGHPRPLLPARATTIT